MRFSGGVGGFERGRNGLGALSAAYAQIMEYGLIFNVYWVIKNCTLDGLERISNFRGAVHFQTAFFVYLTSFNPFFGFALSVSLDSD